MDPILLSTALTSLLPMGIDAVKGWVSKKNDGKPPVTSVEDYSKLVDADLRKMAALAEMEKGDGPSYPWVGAVRQLQRPVVVAIVLSVWGYAAVANNLDEAQFQLASQLASSVFFYLFGERTNFYVRRK